MQCVFASSKRFFLLCFLRKTRKSIFAFGHSKCLKLNLKLATLKSPPVLKPRRFDTCYRQKTIFHPLEDDFTTVAKLTILKQFKTKREVFTITERLIW